MLEAETCSRPLIRAHIDPLMAIALGIVEA
jgi:hypothetical protein